MHAFKAWNLVSFDKCLHLWNQLHKQNTEHFQYPPRNTTPRGHTPLKLNPAPRKPTLYFLSLQMGEGVSFNGTRKGKRPPDFHLKACQAGVQGCQSVCQVHFAHPQPAAAGSGFLRLQTGLGLGALLVPEAGEPAVPTTPPSMVLVSITGKQEDGRPSTRKAQLQIRVCTCPSLH